ncbi:hypothetical protein [Paenibacillus sp. FSL H7-0323]|uniref:hypothetical protein n=1 Tax=Paenibacillus sp. FSL H7-0323 TaxID=2921433 RepID=UPI0030FA13B3
MTQRDWQKDMEMAHTARYEYDISHLNNVLDSLFYWLGAYGGLESAYEKQIVEAGKYSERADAAEARVKELESIIKAANDENDWLISGDADELYGEAISTLYPDTPAPNGEERGNHE